MKKLLSVFLVLMLLGSVALADQYDEYVNQQYDFVNSTDAQLEAYVKLGQALIDNAQAELDKRNGGTEQSGFNGATILNYDGLVITIKDYRVETERFGNETRLNLDVVIENNSKTLTGFNGSTLLINGWQVDGLAYGNILPGKKAKDTFHLVLDDADISTLDEIENIGFEMTVWDDDFNFTSIDPIEIAK